jgi:hypothetical protein
MGISWLGRGMEVFGILGMALSKSARISAKKMPQKEENGVFDFFELIKESLILSSV